MWVRALGCSGASCTAMRPLDELRRETSFLTRRCLHFGRIVLRYIVHWDTNVVLVVLDCSGVTDDCDKLVTWRLTADFGSVLDWLALRKRHNTNMQ